MVLEQVVQPRSDGAAGPEAGENLQAFVTERLVRHRDASPHTIRRLSRLLPAAARPRRTTAGQRPCQLQIDDLDADLIAGFLDHLQRERHGARTRNARLTFLNEAEIDTLLDAPDRSTWMGRRDSS